MVERPDALLVLTPPSPLSTYGGEGGGSSLIPPRQRGLYRIGTPQRTALVSPLRQAQRRLSSETGEGEGVRTNQRLPIPAGRGGIRRAQRG